MVDRFGLTTVPGALDVLDQLSRSPLKVCLISGFSRPTSRLMLERRLPLVDAQLTLASLAALPGPGAPAGGPARVAD